MNLVSVIIIVALVWLLYKLTKTYDSLRKELRDIRLKCVTSQSSYPTKQ